MGSKRRYREINDGRGGYGLEATRRYLEIEIFVEHGGFGLWVGCGLFFYFLKGFWMTFVGALGCGVCWLFDSTYHEAAGLRVHVSRQWNAAKVGKIPRAAIS